jgi:hypothetical protein
MNLKRLEEINRVLRDGPMDHIFISYKSYQTKTQEMDL